MLQQPNVRFLAGYVCNQGLCWFVYQYNTYLFLFKHYSNTLLIKDIDHWLIPKLSYYMRWHNLKKKTTWYLRKVPNSIVKCESLIAIIYFLSLHWVLLILIMIMIWHPIPMGWGLAFFNIYHQLSLYLVTSFQFVTPSKIFPTQLQALNSPSNIISYSRKTIYLRLFHHHSYKPN